MRFNPFKPNGIVTPGMFAGRGEEINDLVRALFQTKHGNPWHFLIHGERGIGKSSLLLVADHLARGSFNPPDANEPHNFVTVNVELEPTTSCDDLISKIGAEFVRELKSVESVRSKMNSTWDFLTKWEVAGIKFNRDDEDAHSVAALCDMIAEAESRVADKIDGVVLLIDEADQGASTCELGEFIKIATERFTKRGCNRVLIGLSGISTVQDALKFSHESSLRILNALELRPLDFEERKEVVRLGLHESHRLSDETITITPQAEDWIAHYSEGYPHFIQQYAYSAFETDNDNEIDDDDVWYGVHKENGALDQLGRRYFEAMYLDKIKSDEYRKVLQALAVSGEEWVKRKDIQESTGLATSTLGNALTALKDRELILTKRGQRGYFKLPNNSFGAWIRVRLVKTAQERKQQREHQDRLFANTRERAAPDN